MTAQINDCFRYKNKKYSVSGISEGRLFDPELLELKPAGVCSACWRGYQATFALSKSRLVLDTLLINLIEDFESYLPIEGPTINGVTPTVSKRKSAGFNNKYSKLNYHLEYSGGLLLADGFIADLYVHMGFHPAWKYLRVVELVFSDGVLLQEYDRSERMAEVRQHILESRNESNDNHPPSKEEIEKFIKQSFDRSYRM